MMQELTSGIVYVLLDLKELIEALRVGLQTEIEVPDRGNYELEEVTNLIMPAWNEKYFGVKRVTIDPKATPSIQGNYELMVKNNPQPIGCTMPAEILTARRTAAASALASSMLSRKDSSTLMMIGAGAMAPDMIRAHALVRPIKKVLVWNRDPEKIKVIQQKLHGKSYTIEAVDKIEYAIHKADIISCATNASEPLIRGAWLVKGQHIDLVGAYKPDRREADSLVIERSSVYVDSLAATTEAGDLVIPYQEGVFNVGDIVSDLSSLCKQPQLGRKNEEEITLFKSVGMASEDLIAAILVYEKLV